MDPSAPTLVRPLRIGEIFDRAITLCVRQFVPLAIIALFVVVPLTIASAFQQHANVDALARVIGEMQGHHAKIAQPPPVNPISIVIIFAALAISPFGYMAITAAIARVYRGETVDWRAAYAMAFSRWAHAIGLLFLSAIVVTAIFVAGVFGVTIVATISALLFASVKAAGVALAVFAIACFLAILAFVMLMLITVFMMFNALVVERAGVFAAFGSGFARIFNRKELLRTFLLSLAFFALQFGVALLSYAIVGIEYFLHAYAIGAVMSAILQFGSMVFFGVLFTVYYFDVRIRQEGSPA